MKIFKLVLLSTALALCGCATAAKAPERVAPPAMAMAAPAALPAVPTLKRKIAVARFSNSTRYGKSLLSENESDPLADQAADMLVSRLIDSGRFIVFERINAPAAYGRPESVGNRIVAELVHHRSEKVAQRGHMDASGIGTRVAALRPRQPLVRNSGRQSSRGMSNATRET